jgi:hypothetical protein
MEAEVCCTAMSSSEVGQTRSPRAAPRNPSGASGNPQIRDSRVAAPKSVGHVPEAAVGKGRNRPPVAACNHLPAAYHVFA